MEEFLQLSDADLAKAARELLGKALIVRRILSERGFGLHSGSFPTSAAVRFAKTEII